MIVGQSGLTITRKEIMLERSFFTAGRAVFTIEFPESFARANGLDTHYTYRIRAPRSGSVLWIDLLTGPDNVGSYTYIATLYPTTGDVRNRKDSAADNSMPVRLVRRVIRRVWDSQQTAIADAGFVLRHAGKCCRCGRRLTHPESLESGWGPECAKLAAL